MQALQASKSKQEPSSAPALSEKTWAVIGAHYFNFGLTHQEAIAEARDLARRKQHAVVVTQAVAQRMIDSAIGVGVATPPDMRF